MAKAERDFLQSDFPMYASIGVLIFFLYRSLVSRGNFEPIQPAWMTKGVFPAAFMTFVGSLACHEMLLDIMAYPGGLTAWTPAILAAAVTLWAAYRGQRAASGGDLGMVSLATVVAIVTVGLTWLMSEGAEEQPQNLTKSQMKKMAKEAAQAAKEAAKRAAKGIVDVPKAKQLFLEKGKDVVTEQMHLALAALVVVALILGVVNGPGVFPRNLQQGAFPSCFMVVTGVMAYNSFLRQARSYEDGCIEDFFPAFGFMLISAAGASWGCRLQKTA